MGRSLHTAHAPGANLRSYSEANNAKFNFANGEPGRASEIRDIPVISQGRLVYIRTYVGDFKGVPLLLGLGEMEMLRINLVTENGPQPLL
jgi:hypothetical protein